MFWFRTSSELLRTLVGLFSERFGIFFGTVLDFVRSVCFLCLFVNFSVVLFFIKLVLLQLFVVFGSCVVTLLEPFWNLLGTCLGMCFGSV